MAQRIGPGARGFTLLELLVAITLLGLLTAALLGLPSPGEPVPVVD